MGVAHGGSRQGERGWSVIDGAPLLLRTGDVHMMLGESGRVRFCRAPRRSSADVHGVLELRHGLIPTVQSSAPTYLRLQRGTRDRANSNGLTVFLRSGLPGRRISPKL